MAADLWMVVGLGNPGSRYRGNRHNVGFMVADTVAAAEGGFDWRPSGRFSAELAKGTLEGRPVLLVKPQTFMNLSGQSVVSLARFYEVATERIIAIHDDVDLELGRLRIKAGGGDGGHKGIRSMAQLLGDPGFVRVRFGVGRPEVGEVEGFVLQDFRPAEQELLAEQLRHAANAVRTVMVAGLKEAMNRHNGPRRGDHDGDDERDRKAKASSKEE